MYKSHYNSANRVIANLKLKIQMCFKRKKILHTRLMLFSAYLALQKLSDYQLICGTIFMDLPETEREREFL